tara:strand:+ start:863 stop:1225 length:363 start_codon:yes stop_codon:yes gene_type:complete
MSILNETDFVYTRDDYGNVQSGGYKIESLLLKQGLPIKDTNKPQKGGGLSAGIVLSDLAVPAGLLYAQQTAKKKRYDTNDYPTVPVDLYDKLLALSQPKKPKNKSLKRSYKKKNRTRKQR